MLEGSGAALPPVAADRTVLVTSAARPAESLVTGMGPYRILVSDMLVVTMCEPPLASREDVDDVRAAVAEIRPDLPVVTTVFRPHPAEPVVGERVALFTTAPAAVHPALRASLEGDHGADVVAVSGALSDRVSPARRPRQARRRRRGHLPDRDQGGGDRRGRRGRRGARSPARVLRQPAAGHGRLTGSGRRASRAGRRGGAGTCLTGAACSGAGRRPSRRPRRPRHASPGSEAGARRCPSRRGGWRRRSCWRASSPSGPTSWRSESSGRSRASPRTRSRSSSCTASSRRCWPRRRARRSCRGITGGTRCSGSTGR